MKRFVFISLLCLVTICGFGTYDAMAVGIGLYIPSGGGSSDWSVESNGSSWDLKKDTSHLGFGLVLDTAVAKD